MTHWASITGWKRAALAATIAYALVLQAMLLSLGGALHVARAGEPQAILCAQDGRTSSDHAPAGSHDGLCCILGCHGAGPAGPAPVSVSLLRLAPVSLETRLPVTVPTLRLSSNVLPVGSRAPPRLG